MKANELMIGDWVLLCDMKVKILSINLYCGEDSMGGHYFAIMGGHCSAITVPQYADTNMWIDVLQPIPLTPEILEKNFGKPAMCGTYNQFDSYTLKRDGGKGAYIIRDTSRYTVLNSYAITVADYAEIELCQVYYVHELQHALRLCGIDKEIVL